MKRFRVIENVYRHHLDVFICPDYQAARRALARLWAVEGDELPDGGPALAKTLIDKEKCRVAIWLKNPKDLASLVHELTHVVVYILDHCGISIDPDHDEPAAYLMQFFMNSTLHALGYGRFTSR